MLEHGVVAIVDIASISGMGASPGASVYAANKAGVISLMSTAVKEYTASGIRVHTIVWRVIRTPLLECVLPVLGEADPAQGEM